MNIIEIARQAGVRDDGYRFEFSELKYLEQFAKLVVANIDPKSFMTYHEGYERGVTHEREECIQNVLQQHEGFGTEHQGVGYVKQRIVDAIRARSKA